MRLLFALLRQDVVCIDMVVDLSRRYFDASVHHQGFYGRDAVVEDAGDAACKTTSHQ